MYECLVTGSLGTGFLKSFLVTVLLGFLGGTNLVWELGKKFSAHFLLKKATMALLIYYT